MTNETAYGGKSIKVAIGLTVSWLIVIFLFFHVPSSYWPNYDLPSDSNALGDLLAGIFAPLAFIWLVVGYFMQAKELALTRIELVGQSKAQERLARETEIANQNRMAGQQPTFALQDISLLDEGFQVVVRNDGAEITSVVASLDNSRQVAQSTWRKYEHIKFSCRGGAIREGLENKDEYVEAISGFVLKVSFTSNLGQEHVQSYEFNRLTQAFTEE
jgi:hypothetical protein